jgi:hypothetical protein
MNPSIYVVIDIIPVSAIFDIRTCPFGVVAAPVFQLAPSVLNALSIIIICP